MPNWRHAVATVETRFWNFGVLATKSVSQFTFTTQI